MEIRKAIPIDVIEETFVDGIIDVIINNSQLECRKEDEVIVFPNVDSVNNFKDYGVVTKDNGIVVLLEDNTEVYITVKAVRRHWFD